MARPRDPIAWETHPSALLFLGVFGALSIACGGKLEHEPEASGGSFHGVNPHPPRDPRSTDAPSAAQKPPGVASSLAVCGCEPSKLSLSLSTSSELFEFNAVAPLQAFTPHELTCLPEGAAIGSERCGRFAAIAGCDSAGSCLRISEDDSGVSLTWQKAGGNSVRQVVGSGEIKTSYEGPYATGEFYFWDDQDVTHQGSFVACNTLYPCPSDMLPP